jgi:sugar phosphate permease
VDLDALLSLLQWPAMVATVLASWLVASGQAGRRRFGFWVFLASNVLWVAWGWHTGARALVLLQFCLAALNIRGARKAEQAEQD